MKKIWLVMCMSLSIRVMHAQNAFQQKFAQKLADFCRSVPLKTFDDFVDAFDTSHTAFIFDGTVFTDEELQLFDKASIANSFHWGLHSCLFKQRIAEFNKFVIDVSTLTDRQMELLIKFWHAGDIVDLGSFDWACDFTNFYKEAPDFCRQFIQAFFSYRGNIDLSTWNGYEFLASFFSEPLRTETLGIIKKQHAEHTLNMALFDKEFFLEFIYKDARLRKFLEELNVPAVKKIEEREMLLENFKKNNPRLPSVVHLNTMSDQDMTRKTLYAAPFGQFMRALEKERDLEKTDYVMFYHGQSSGYAFMNDVANILYKKLHGEKKLQMFLQNFLHHLSIEHDIEVQKNEVTPVDFFFLQFHPGQSVKETTLKHENMLLGRDKKNEKIRLPERLSLNLFAFGNMTNPGSYTFGYVDSNTNIHDADVAVLRKFFEIFEIPEGLFEKYKKRITELMDQYDKAHEKGRLICIAFPKKTVDKYVYIAEPGAYRIKTRMSNEGSVLSTVSQLLEQLSSSREASFNPRRLDELEFAAPLTAYGVLNPHTGVKLFKFDDERADPKKLEVLKQEMQKLTQDIVTDLKNGQLLEKAKDILESREDLNKKIAQEQNKNNTALVIGGLAATAASSYGALKMYEKYKDQEKAEQRQPSQQPTQQPYQPLVVRPPEVDTWRARAAKWLPWFNRQVKKLPRA